MIPLQIWWARGNLHQGAGWGSAAGKLLRENIRGKGVLAKLTQQDSLLKTDQDDQTSPGGW